MVSTTWITIVILELIYSTNPQFLKGMHLLDKRLIQVFLIAMIIHIITWWIARPSCQQCLIQILTLSIFNGNGGEMMKNYDLISERSLGNDYHIQGRQHVCKLLHERLEGTLRAFESGISLIWSWYCLAWWSRF